MDALAKFVKKNVLGAIGFLAPAEFPEKPETRVYAQAIMSYRKAPLNSKKADPLPLYLFGPGTFNSPSVQSSPTATR